RFFAYKLFDAGRVLVAHSMNSNGSSRPTLDFPGIAAEHVPHAAADDADAQQPDVDGLHCSFRLRRNCRWRLTSGHSAARMLYITVSRMLPSRRGQWWRITPSFFAPSASMARCERKLKLSVRRPITLQPAFSNPYSSSSILQVVFTWLRWQRCAYQVQPIS